MAAGEPYVASSAVIMDGVRFGRNVRIGHGVVIYPFTEIGNDVTVWDGAVLGRPPQGAGNLARQPRDDLPPLRIGDSCVIGACAVVYRGTTVGRNVLIADLASIREECEIGDYVVIARGVTVNYRTRIGHHTKVMDNTHLTGNMVIEDHVFISVLVSSTNDNTMGVHDSGLVPKGPIVRRGARIGASAVLLPGVEVGAYAVVGAGAVVTRDVPPRKVVMGVPARVVRDA